MYLVVSYDTCDRIDEIFHTFQEAKIKFKELDDPTYTLEFYNKWYVRKILLGKGKRPYNKVPYVKPPYKKKPV